MARLRRNEWNFAHNVAALITEALSQPELMDSLLGHAEPELTELHGAKRLDLVIFKRNGANVPLVTGELKLPWAADGRTPYNGKLIDDAHGKASKVGALYFITWNVRRVVVWKTDDPGVSLDQRVLYDKETLAQPIRSVGDLDSPRVKESLANGINELVRFLDSLLSGPPQPTFLPLDRLFIARIEAALDFPVDSAARELQSQIEQDVATRNAFERWMREKQGWVVSQALTEENAERASRFTSYVLVNRLCFYNALRRKYQQLPRLIVANNINTGALLKRRLQRAFADAQRYTGDYETVFDEDLGDSIPYMSDEAVPEWRRLTRSLDQYDFASISLDIIGAMYEQLISPEERHRYGQHYTQPAVVDLINSFAIKQGDSRVLDSACGGGTFLVRAYARKAFLDPTLDHTELLETIFGCDILNYACHLSTINLAVLNLIDDDNFPRIHLGDFLKLQPDSVFYERPTRLQAGGLITGRQAITIPREHFDCIVGNPPYISSRVMTAADKKAYHEAQNTAWNGYSWTRSADIYTYFWTHSMHFLRQGGCLALLTQAAWLDTEYGFPVQQWMLDNFRIVAILESESEPWFSDARVATVVTILEREDSSETRNDNLVRFVQFRSRLQDLLGERQGDRARLEAVDELRRQLEEITEDTDAEKFRVRTVSQEKLADRGTGPMGQYVGDKWGRYLRSIETLYSLQEKHSNRFTRLDDIADVQRGSTTNCDKFFIASDISDETLGRIPSGDAFLNRYGVSRDAVATHRIAIVKRSDGFEAGLERDLLQPIMKTGRKFNWFSTSHLETSDFAVVLPDNRRELSRLALRYVEAAEREEWHLSPSFENITRRGGNWFVLRMEIAPPILFIKTMQYTPVVLWNESEHLPNQRLYRITPSETFDPKVLCSVLNSTVVAAERYASAKALGREAAIDAEVFTVKMLKVPNPRLISAADQGSLRTLLDELCRREARPLLEEALLDAQHKEAQRYAERHPVTSEVWPEELTDPLRQELDSIVLRASGVRASEVPATRARLYNELTQHTRTLRLLELEAQINRQGTRRHGTVSARILAAEIWAHMPDKPRNVPTDFEADIETDERVTIPSSGRIERLPPSLFDSHFTLRVGSEELMFVSEQHRDYAALLADIGVRGEVSLPRHQDDCLGLTEQVKNYVAQVRSAFEQAAEEVTSDRDLHERVVREGLKKIVV